MGRANVTAENQAVQPGTSSASARKTTSGAAEISPREDQAYRSRLDEVETHRTQTASHGRNPWAQPDAD